MAGFRADAAGFPGEEDVMAPKVCTGGKGCKAAQHYAGCPGIRVAAQHWFASGGG